MNISLTPQQQHFIDESLGSGQYHTAAEVVREGLRLLMRREERNHAELELMRNEIQRRLDSAEADRSDTSPDTFHDLRLKIRSLDDSA
jgi:antitoxin ParD1/3/4